MGRFNASGSVDTNFGSAGVVTVSGFSNGLSMNLMSSGKLVVVGQASSSSLMLQQFNTLATSQTYYAEYDANYNITSLTNSSGTVVERYVYSAYGIVTVLNADGTVRGDGTGVSSFAASDYLYQGMRYSGSTGTYATETRVYSPSLGRPLQEDPTGAAYPDGPNDEQWELSDPVDCNDPTGTQSIPLTLGPSAFASLTPQQILAFQAAKNVEDARAARDRLAAAVKNWLAQNPSTCAFDAPPELRVPSDLWKSWQAAIADADAAEYAFNHSVYGRVDTSFTASGGDVIQHYGGGTGADAAIQALNELNSLRPDPGLGSPTIDPVTIGVAGLTVPFLAAVDALTAESTAATAGSAAAAESAPLGDLTAEEQAQIQQAVNDANRPINVVGSAAKGTRCPTSDIDYTAPSSSHGNFDGQELPGVDPDHGILHGAPDPYQGPSIRFEPNAPPTFVPKKG